MPKIIPIVEGFGEVNSVPALLRKILWERNGRYDFEIGQAKNSHGCDNMLKPEGVEYFFRLATSEVDCGAVIIVVDADEKCPVEVAHTIANRITVLNPNVPAVVVVAKCEYEVWFLASIETVAEHSKLGEDVTLEGAVEIIASPKGWLKQRMPKGTTYKETIDQVSMTSLIDLELASSRSRSFRRLCHAVEEIVAAIDEGKAIVTPAIER